MDRNQHLSDQLSGSDGHFSACAQHLRPHSPTIKPQRTRRCAPRRGSCPSPTVPLVWVALNPRATTANKPAILSIFSVEIQPREGEGTIRRALSSSLLFLSFFFFPLSFSFPPSPSNSTPRVLSSSLRAECGNSSLICGTRQAAWSRRRTPGCPRSTSPHRNCTRRTAGRVDGRGSN